MMKGKEREKRKTICWTLKEHMTEKTTKKEARKEKAGLKNSEGNKEDKTTLFLIFLS